MSKPSYLCISGIFRIFDLGYQDQSKRLFSGRGQGTLFNHLTGEAGWNILN